MRFPNAVLLLGALLGGAEACSSFIYKCDTTGNLPVSGHTFDHGMDLRQSVVTLPAGFVFAAAEPCEDCPAQNFTLEHGVAYVAATGGGYIGAALHGLNSAGLAGGTQTLDDAKGPALQYRPDGPATALAWPEVLLYLLGSYSTVDEVAKQFTPQTHQVITDFGSRALRDGVKYLFHSTDNVPVHISLYDASGDGAVIEFDGEKGWTMFHNVTAVTNMPRYPEQLDNLKRWRAARQDTIRHMAEILQGSFEVVFQQLPGSYSPAARFVRLSELLKQVCGSDDTPYPDRINWSPSFDGVGDVPGREALAQAAGILQTVDVTYGFTFPQSGWTQVASLRDHSNRVLYWRTPLTARWQGVNVSAAAAADGPQILPLWEGWEDAFEDVTALLEPIPGFEPGPADPGEMEQLLPVLNGTTPTNGG